MIDDAEWARGVAEARRLDLWPGDGERYRVALRPGTVLETYDCAYLTVKAVTAEGIVADTPVSRDYLWTWASLESLGATIHYHPREGALPSFVNTVPRLRERGGWLAASPELEGRLEMGGEDVKRRAAHEVGRLAREHGCGAGETAGSTTHPNGTWRYAAACAAGALPITDALRAELDALVAHLRQTGMPPLAGFTIRYETADAGARYEATFRYEGE